MGWKDLGGFEMIFHNCFYCKSIQSDNKCSCCEEYYCDEHAQNCIVCMNSIICIDCMNDWDHCHDDETEPFFQNWILQAGWEK